MEVLYISDILIFFRLMQRKVRIFKILNFHRFSFQLNFETFPLSTNCTKISIKWTKIHLQTSVIPIWKAENQGYKIGYEQSLLGQLKGPKNGPEKCVRIYSATTVVSQSTNGKIIFKSLMGRPQGR